MPTTKLSEARTPTGSAKYFSSSVRTCAGVSSAISSSPGEPPLITQELSARRTRNENWEEMMQIGDPLRTIIVEPLELPVEEPTAEPRPEPWHAPEPAPDQVPAVP